MTRILFFKLKTLKTIALTFQRGIHVACLQGYIPWLFNEAEWKRKISSSFNALSALFIYFLLLNIEFLHDKLFLLVWISSVQQ